MPTLAPIRGQMSRLRLRAEASFGVLPSGNFIETPYYTESLTGAQALQADPVIGVARANVRDQTGPAPALRSAAGQMEVPVCVNGFGYWLTALMGEPTTTEVSGVFTHVWKSGSVELPSLAIVNVMGASLIKRSLGMVLDTMEIDLGKTDGFRRARLGFQGADVSMESSVATGTPPTGLTYKAIPNQILGAEIDTLAADYVMGGSIRFANALAVDQYLDGKETASAIYPGVGEVTGRLQVRVMNADIIGWAQSLSTVKRLTLEMATGAANETLTIDLPRVRLERAAPPIQGPAGITFDANFRAEQGTASGQDMATITLVNAVAGTAYTTALGL